MAAKIIARMGVRKCGGLTFLGNLARIAALGAGVVRSHEAKHANSWIGSLVLAPNSTVEDGVAVSNDQNLWIGPRPGSVEAPGRHPDTR